MPYNSTDKIVYIDTTTTPHTGISMADIQAAVNDSHSDIGGLITYGEINKYAMYKPFRALSPGFLSDSARNSALVAAGYGISTTSQRTVTAFLDAFEGGTFEWVYERPRGANRTPKEWFRMLDFNGYNSKSRNPCGTFRVYPTTPVDRNGGTITASMSKTFPISGWATDGLTIREVYDDVGSSRTYYFGVMLVPDNPATYGYKLITDTVSIFRDEEDEQDLQRGDERMRVQKTLSSTFHTGEWTVYPFLTDVSLNSMLDVSYSDRNNNLPNGMRLYPLAEATSGSITVVDGLIIINPTARAASIHSGNTTDVEWSFVITNNTTSSITLTGGTIKFRLSGKTYAEALTNEETEIALSSISGLSQFSTITLAPTESIRVPGDGLTFDSSNINVNTNVMWVGYMQNYQQRTGSTTYFVPVNPYDNNLEVEP